MNYCFRCGGALVRTRSVSLDERFRCEKCRRGYLLHRTGRCVFLSNTMPTDADATRAAGSKPKEEPKPNPDDFDLGLDEPVPVEIDLGF